MSLTRTILTRAEFIVSLIVASCVCARRTFSYLLCGYRFMLQFSHPRNTQGRGLSVSLVWLATRWQFLPRPPPLSVQRVLPAHVAAARGECWHTCGLVRSIAAWSHSPTTPGRHWPSDGAEGRAQRSSVLFVLLALLVFTLCRRRAEEL